MEDFRLTQSGQEVQDILNGAAMQVDLTAETERATEAEQTLQGNIDAEATRAQGAEGTLQDNIDAEETRAKAAEKQNADDIDAIEEKIPSGASTLNKLATEEYVNDSVATATAAFRGTYNVVTDLNLLPSATHSQISASLQTEIATADSNDYAFVLIPTSVETPEEIEKIERYKYNGSVWGFEYVLNNSGFTAAQWDAINSGITSNAVGKLDALPNNAELTILLNGKQDTLTFDNVPTQGSSNPVKSGGVYSAIKSEETRAMAAESQISSAIEAILLLIPSAASALNQLADKAFVNSSIATATATFRGTYNLVTDLSLNVNATHSQIAGALGINISTADNNDYAFVQIPTSLETPTEIRVTERYKFNGTSWAFEYDLNNSGFTSAQWAAINSGITIALVGKLNGLPTNAELTTLLNGKQDTLTFDNVPTQGSDNPVKSSGIYNVIKAITDLIPAEATAQNQLADKADVAAKIVAAIPSWKGQYDALTDLQAVTGAKAGDMGCVKTTDSEGHAVLTFYQYSAQDAWVEYYVLRHYAQNKPATTGTTGDYPYNGMGRIELQKNIVNGVNTLTQAMLTQQNTIYVIQYDFILGENINVPANCVLEFEGGSISGSSSNILNLNNSTDIVGQGLNCYVSNVKQSDKAVYLSEYIKDISDSAKNTSVLQALIDSGNTIYADISLSFSTAISAKNVKIIGVHKPTFTFANSDGFVYDKGGLSNFDRVKGIIIHSKGHCFKFDGNPTTGVYDSVFEDIVATSDEGSCFYTGQNTYYTCFQMSFTDINVTAPNGSGFYGFTSVGMIYKNIHGSYCKDATFTDCNGLWLNYNGTFGSGSQVSSTFLKSSGNTYNPNWKCIFINCNFESYTGSIFDVNGMGDYMFLTCKFDQTSITPSDTPVKLMGSIGNIVFRNCYWANSLPANSPFVEISSYLSQKIDTDYEIFVKDGFNEVIKFGYDIGILSSIDTRVVEKYASYVSNYGYKVPILETPLIRPVWRKATLDETNQIIYPIDSNFISIEDTTLATIAHPGNGSVRDQMLLIKNNTDHSITFVNNSWGNKIITNTGNDIVLASGEVMRGYLKAVDTSVGINTLYIWSPINDTNFAQNLC